MICRGGRPMLRNMVVLTKGWTLSWQRYWQRGRYFSKGEGGRRGREIERARGGEERSKGWVGREGRSLLMSQAMNLIFPVLGVWDSALTVVRVKRNWKRFYQIWRFVEPLSSRWTRSLTEWFPWLRARTTSTASSHSNEQDRYEWYTILSPTLHGMMEVLTLV